MVFCLELKELEEKNLKKGTEVTLNLSSNMTGNSNDETNFQHNLLLTNTQVSKIWKVQIVPQLI